MTESTPPTPPVSDEQLISRFTGITFRFCGGLVMVLAVGVFIIPNRSIHTRGIVIGVALGLIAWFASRWITRYSLSKAAHADTKNLDAAGTRAGAIGTAVFLGIFFAETSALVGLALAMINNGDIGPFIVAIPAAIVAIVFNASGPGAMRRHLDSLRA